MPPPTSVTDHVRLARRIGLALVVTAALAATACAKFEEPVATPPRTPTIAYGASKVIPAGKTLRAAKADGSIKREQVPADVGGDDGVDDIGSIECLVAGRALPVGAVLRRSQFVDPREIGIDRGLTDGTTVDPEC